MEYGPTRCRACRSALSATIGQHCPFCRAPLFPKSRREQRQERRARRAAPGAVPVGAPPGRSAAAPQSESTSVYEWSAPGSPPAPAEPPSVAVPPWLVDPAAPSLAPPPVAPAPPPPVEFPVAPAPPPPVEPPVALPPPPPWSEPAAPAPSSWGDPAVLPPPAARPRPRRAVAVGVAVALVASAAGVAGWRALRPSGPGHPSAWDPRVADLVSFVEGDRGLTYKHPVYIDFLGEADFNKQVTTHDGDLSADDRKQMEQAAGMFRALGLIDGDVNLLDAVNKLQTEAALAFYDPKTQRVRVRGTDLTVKVRGTLVHELTHALQDQYFDLSREGHFPLDAQNDTYRPVFEGDAEHTEHDWVEKLGGADRAAYEQAADAESASVDLSGVPDAVVQFFAAPYTFGEPFVGILVDAKGGKAVDEALRNPPTSDADLLDPFRYLDGGSPAIVREPELAAGEKKTDSGAFGAIALYLVLAQRMDAAKALAATDAWGGDAYVDYVRNGRSCVRADFTGKDAAGTTLLADVLQTWAGGRPSGTASVTRQADLVELDACDPGAGAAKAPTGDLAAAVSLAVARTDIAHELMSSHMAAPEARCIAGRFLAAFSPAETQALLQAASPDDLPPAVQQRAAAAAKSCLTGR